MLNVGTLFNLAIADGSSVAKTTTSASITRNGVQWSVPSLTPPILGAICDSLYASDARTRRGDMRGA